MTEEYQRPSEETARNEVVEIYKTLAIPSLDNNSATDLWRNLLIKTRSRFEKFRYKPTHYGDLLFVPQIHQGESDEQVRFYSQTPSVGYQPTIEWRVLQRKNSEAKELFTAILSLKNGDPNIALMQEAFSIFRVRDLKIDDLMIQWAPKMDTHTVTIRPGQDAYFSKEELGKKVDGGYIPTEEALQKITIPA